jgi:toxin ParE1/3/4
VIEIRYHYEADEELDWAMRQSERPKEFREEYQNAVELITSYLEIGSIVLKKHNIREFILPRLPYRIVYQVIDDEIFIVAIAHLKRRSRYWKSRLS